jgi:hypothetical protein
MHILNIEHEAFANDCRVTELKRVTVFSEHIRRISIMFEDSIFQVISDRSMKSIDLDLSTLAVISVDDVSDQKRQVSYHIPSLPIATSKFSSLMPREFIFPSKSSKQSLALVCTSRSTTCIN